MRRILSAHLKEEVGYGKVIFVGLLLDSGFSRPGSGLREI
jgi:hypothetical protein